MYIITQERTIHKTDDVKTVIIKQGEKMVQAKSVPDSYNRSFINNLNNNIRKVS